ncbi:MAG TPA: dihydropteroate synthase [Planctomycetota bacterium]|nr:dihydropteroate synthase [Planctomycetota bacterium]
MESREVLFGPRALALAPRIEPAGERWRIRVRAGGLTPRDRETLAGLGLEARGELAELACDPADLSELASRSPAAEILFAALEALRAPRRRPRIMGVLNVTPDSFSNGGEHLDPDRALQRGLEMAAEGAELIDVGGESTRPGSDPVSEDEELRRVIPLVEALAPRVAIPISVDTTKAAVAERALDAGARMVNDVSAGRADPRMLPLVAERGCEIVLMHMQGTPRDMQRNPSYGDVCGEVAEFLRQRVAACLEAGIALERIAIDPGIGFGKTLEHNLELLRSLGELRALSLPICVALSRKSFIAAIERADLPANAPVPAPAERRGGALAALAMCIGRGAEILRVHDVRASVQAARVAWALA